MRTALMAPEHISLSPLGVFYGSGPRGRHTEIIPAVTNVLRGY
jgi:hypothetical protein